MNEVDNAPVFQPVGLQEVDELQAYTLTVTAQDPDTPSRAIAYSLQTGPAGLQIHATSGAMTWTPSEAQGPNSCNIVIRASEVGGSQTSTLALSIVVNEANQAPVLSAIPNRTVSEGATIDFLCVASDADLPPPRLSFRLASGAPAGASIDSATGRFTWAVGEDAGSGTHVITVQVTDDAIQALTASATFSVVVVAVPQIVINETMYRESTAGAEYVELHNLSTNTAWLLDGWVELGYDDGGWPAGRALLYVEEATLPAPKNTALTLGAMSTYFRTRFQFDGNPEGASLPHWTVVDDGAVVYLNGQPSFWLGMTEGHVPERDTAATRTVADAVVEGPFLVPATGLRTGENVVAVSAHQTNPGSSDLVFGLAVDVLEVRREALTPGYANSVRSALEPFPSLFLSEVVADNTSGLLDAAGDQDPWIELGNLGPVAALKGYSLGATYGSPATWPFPADATLGA